MIYIARHGQTDWNAQKRLMGSTDIPLNDNGKAQAEILADSISKSQIDVKHIFSSDLLRAKETAKIIDNHFKVGIKFDQRLRELNYGDLEGTNLKTTSQEMWDTLHKQPEKLNAENFESLYNRVKSFFNELSENGIDDALIITHGGTSRMIMYFTKNRDKLNKEDYITNYIPQKINNGELFKFELHKKLEKIRIKDSNKKEDSSVLHL